jgi:hypothetical protein
MRDVRVTPAAKRPGGKGTELELRVTIPNA